MSQLRCYRVIVLACFLMLWGGNLSSSFADVRLPKVINSHMVLQQDKALCFWGWADPGEAVSLIIADKRKKTEADSRGNWKIELEPMSAGGPYQIQIQGKNSISLDDVWVGEVWICSGQSNMEWQLSRTHSPTPEIWRADFPRIRLFKVPRKVAVSPQTDVEAEWEICSPETASGFSAVAYYFGRELYRELDVPVGLINTSWGGTRIEPWTPPEGFAAVPELAGILESVKQANDDYRDSLTEAIPIMQAWIKTAQKAVSEKSGWPEIPEFPSHALDGPQEPTALYNGMIHPFVNFSIRGAIWYQGESNRNDGAVYAKKMEALISGWRKVWNQDDFPFYYVQLATYNYPYNREGDGGDVPDFYRLPVIWEAQTEALRIRNTGMVVITDITNLNDIHPRNKFDVGYRLSLWARAQTYGESSLVYSGPLYKKMAREGDKIRIFFDHTAGALVSLDGRPLSWFEIAGADRTFFKAAAEISGETVLVWSPQVSKPEAVRFGWHQLAVPNLANKSGLPASPFRTDRW